MLLFDDPSSPRIRLQVRFSMRRGLNTGRSLLLAAVILVLCLIFLLQSTIHGFFLPRRGIAKKVIEYGAAFRGNNEFGESRHRIPNFHINELPGLTGYEENVDDPVYGVALDDPAGAVSYNETADPFEMSDHRFDFQSDLETEREDTLWQLEIENEVDT